jgi:hypothetical protein
MATIGLLLEPLTVRSSGVTEVDFPSWREVILRWGMALVWLTTPHMPPWWRYISGRYKTLNEARLAAVSHIVSGLDPSEDAPQYTSSETLPPGVVERRTGYDRREHSP